MYSPPAASMGCWPSHLLPGGWGCLWGRRTLKAIYEPKAFKAYLQTPYWCAGTTDSTEPIFIQMGATLMQHPAFLALTTTDRWCYQCMILEAKGNPLFNFHAELLKITELRTAH